MRVDWQAECSSGALGAGWRPAPSRRAQGVVGLALLLVLGGTPALALHEGGGAVNPCLMVDYVEPTRWKPAVDEPIEVLPDGSFSRTSEADNYYRDAVGEPVVDVGGGIIAQKITYWFHNCGPREKLLIVDCKTTQAIELDPPTRQWDPFVEDFSLMALTIHLQPPHGPISLHPGLTIGGLAETAEAHGIHYTTDVMEEIERREPQNRWSPLQGCRIFYPDLPGSGG